MSNKADRRAEARRRARLQAAGVEIEPGGDGPDGGTPQPPRRGLLGSLFPPAPPLRGKPDPLADFTYRGPMAGALSSFWLLGRHPFVWGAAGVGWGFSQVVLIFLGRHPMAFVLSLIQYTLLIAAGWIGWQRPWLFGLAAAMAGLVAYLGIVTVIGRADGVPVAWVPFAVGIVASLGLLQPVLGALAGFYGGYLRRRMQPPAPTKGTRSRARKTR